MSKSELWAVAIRPECDSPFKQSPAASKELAEQAVARYRKLHHRMFHSEVIANAYDELFQAQQWHGTRKDHIRKMFYTADWFKKAMYQCFDVGMAERVFKFGEIVNCFKSVKHYKKGDSPFVTANFEEAKRFYEESKADVEES